MVMWCWCLRNGRTVTYGVIVGTVRAPQNQGNPAHTSVKRRASMKVMRNTRKVRPLSLIADTPPGGNCLTLPFTILTTGYSYLTVYKRVQVAPI